MKPLQLLCLVLLSTFVLPPVTLAQQPRTRRERERGQRVDPRAANETFQILGFTFATGDDDLHDNSALTAHLTFPDGSKQDCPLHGSVAAGNDASIAWENHSMHQAAPCHLDRARTAADLRRGVFGLELSGWNPLNTFDTGDNWNISRVTVTAYNSNSPTRLCVFDGRGNPFARMTESQSKLTLTDFPNQCR